jgi:uncharacterized short protein YbdD (DUF466 family)
VTLQVPDPVDVEPESPNARQNPIFKIPMSRKQWQYRCPVCGCEGKRKVTKKHHLKKGRTGPSVWLSHNPLLTRKQAKDALVSHMKYKHPASPVGVRLR